MIAKRVAMMFSGYPQSDFTNPEAAAVSMCSVFEDYSDAIIRFATDPKTGVQRRHKWPPKIAEVVEFCTERVEHIEKMERYQNWGKKPAMIEGPQELRPTLEEMHEKYGKDWGLGRDEARVKTMEPAPSWDKIVADMQADPSIASRLVAPLMKRG